MSGLLRQMVKWIHGCPSEERLIEYALDGLADPERDRAARHLEHCQQCREQVRQHLSMQEGLALMAPQVEPPEGMAASIYQHVCSKDAGRRVPPAVPAPPSAPAIPAWARFWALAGPASALLCVLLAFWMGVSMRRMETLALGAASAAPGGAEAGVLKMMAQHHVMAVRMDGMGPGKAARRCWGRLLLVPGDRQAALILDRMRPLPAGRVYVLWGMRGGGEKTNLGSFRVDSPGSSMTLLNLTRAPDLTRAMTFGVTEEARADGEKPSGRLEMLGKLTLS